MFRGSSVGRRTIWLHPSLARPNMSGKRAAPFQTILLTSWSVRDPPLADHAKSVEHDKSQRVGFVQSNCHQGNLVLVLRAEIRYAPATRHLFTETELI